MLALVLGLLTVLAIRVLAVFVPGRPLWGFDLWRDVPEAEWIASVVVVLVAMVPAVGRRLTRLLPDSAGMLFASALVVATALAMFTLAHPDRALYTGDASLRHGEFATLEHPETVAPQATRGDLYLHHALPRAVAASTPMTPEDVGRAQGALLAFLTALAGWRLAVAAGTRGLVALAVATIAASTGALALDNGYAKASVEVCALATLLAAGVVRLENDGRGLGTVGVSLGLALLLHRSALALVPVWLVGAVLVFRTRRRPDGSTWLGLLAPLAALSIAGPDLWRVVSGYDRAQHLPTSSGALLARFQAARLADRANVLGLLVPLAPVLPLLLSLRPRLGARQWALAAALVIPPLALLVLVPPQQGLFRDWDVFAFAGSVVAALLAWRFAAVLSATSRARSLAAAFGLASLLPALQWAAIQSDPPRLWARAESILVGPPFRETEERAQGLATLGLLRYARGQFADARRLFQRSLDLSPHPRMLVQWGILAGLSGHPDEAMGYYRRATQIRPDLASAWQGVAEVGITLGDAASVREAVTRLVELEPTNPALPAAKQWLGLSR